MCMKIWSGMYGAGRDKKRASDPLKSELQMVVGQHVNSEK